jgi:hypothetical protein
MEQPMSVDKEKKTMVVKFPSMKEPSALTDICQYHSQHVEEFLTIP